MTMDIGLGRDGVSNARAENAVTAAAPRACTAGELRAGRDSAKAGDSTVTQGAMD
jgi:hypothetical protein